jgi:hypothetical protein
MSSFLRFKGAVRQQPQIEAWFESRRPELAAIAREWFTEMRGCGEDVTELLHDGHPTACVTDAAFGYVNVFTSHVNIGFFHGASLKDPAQLLQGTGKYMRHVKAKPGALPARGPLKALVLAAYADIKTKLLTEQVGGERRSELPPDKSVKSKRGG